MDPFPNFAAMLASPQTAVSDYFAAVTLKRHLNA